MNEGDIRRLTQENRSLAQKILDAIRDLIRKLKGGENQKLYEMEKLWASALKEGKKNTANEGGVRYSISEIEGEKKKYGTGVILDTNLFDGAKPRGWGRILGDYVYKNLAGKELTVYDEDGKPETVHLARLNDRVKKDGAKSSHKVIDKLARYNGDNTRALATVHLAEALETSRNETSTDEHNHQWMDENGWTLRKAYLQDRSGNIYEATLNIADGRDRKILYDINNIRLIDQAKKRTADGDVPSTENGRGSHINSSSKGMVPETSAKSNPKNAEKTKKSLKSYTEEEKKQHVKDASAHFGRTYKWSETGYITPDGGRLDFSGRHEGGPGGYRTVDHRDIRDALGDDYGGDDYSGSMVQFMSEGNIRVSPESGGIDLSVKPTKAQEAALSDFISKQRGEVILDLDTPEGQTVSSTEYPRGTHASKVIADIRAYFEDGKTPQVPEVARYRQSLKGSKEAAEETERHIRKTRQGRRIRPCRSHFSGIGRRGGTYSGAERGGGPAKRKQRRENQ